MLAHPVPGSRGVTWRLACCVLLSGLAGLVFEICWIRLAALQFGSTLQATSLVLAVFFLGLGLGSHAFGLRSRRARRPMQWVAAIEMGVGALALASVPGFPVAERLYDAAQRHLAFGSSAAWGIHALAVTVLLLPPALLMGGTIPFLCRASVDDEEQVGGTIAVLYALNTLGAAVGAALAGFVLIPTIGISSAVVLAACCNFTAAAIAWTARHQAAAERGPAATIPRALDPGGASGRAFVFASLFVTGFAALGQEVLWTRFLALVVRNTVYTYTLTIVVVLSGILLGSFGAAILLRRQERAVGWLTFLQVAQGIAVLALMSLPAAWWMSARQPVVAFALLMLAPSIFSGASFPIATRLVVQSAADAGAGFGRATALNTLGGIAGSLVAGFVLLPRFGLAVAIPVLAGASVLAAALAWWSRPGARAPGRAVFGAAAIAGAFIVIPRIAGTHVPEDFLSNGGELVAVREGLQSNLAILRRDGVVSLEIDRWWQGESRRTHQIVAAHLPMLLHPAPRRVLVVGVGAGQTPARFLLYPIDRLDCVDIEPAVFDLIRPHFDSRWMSDPRVRLIGADGRGFLMHSNERWDVISLEVGQMFRPGAATFYTEEFYRRARTRLAPGGMISQFVPISFLGTHSFASILQTFRHVFPNATLWYNTAELLLIGGNGGPVRFDRPRFESLASDSLLRADLHFAYWGGEAFALDRPANILGGYLCGPDGIAALSRGAALDRDDRPELDYATAGAEEADLNELPILALLRAHLDPLPGVLASAADSSLVAQASRTRSANLGDLAANAQLRRIDAPRRAGDFASVLGLVEGALHENPDNLDAERMRGETMLLLGRDHEAMTSLRRVADERPADADARRSLAMLLHRQRRFADAIALYRESLALAPDRVDTHNNLGAALAESGRLTEAASEFGEVLRLRPGDPDATRNLATLRMALEAAGAAK